MKYISVALISLLLAGCSLSTPQIVDKVQNGVVMIDNDVDASHSGLGTGFIVGDNKIITNNHVVENNTKLYVFSRNSLVQYEAEVVYTDKVADIAIVKIKDWDKFKQNERPNILSFGDSEQQRVGEKVVVLGHPWGFGWSVSEGIVSAKNRRPEGSPKFVDQVDAHLYNGNSGGPIFNEKGEVICVSNLMYAREGGSYGFCIPSNLVEKVIYDFETLKEVRWRVLNISSGMSEDGSAVVVKSIEPNGAASTAGVQACDKILKISTPKNHPNGIMVKSPDDLITELASLRGDDEVVKLSIERNGKKLEVDVKTNFKLSKEFNPQ